MGKTWLSGLHDDEYFKEILRKKPNSLIGNAYIHPEKLTKEQAERAVKLTGDFEIAERWIYAHICKDCKKLKENKNDWMDGL
jgi:hypothetical protein